MSQFDDYAIEKIKQQMSASAGQVGSNYEGNKGGKDATDCITFVMRVLVHAYEKIGKPGAAAEVRKRSAYGAKLAKYLVDQRTWRAFYWNPDVRRPRDNDGEHPSSYKTAKEKHTYYQIPLAGAIINYRLTPSPKPLTKLDTAALNRFKLVPFAVGIACGGDHTFLCSFGELYEVHYKSIGADLYEVSEFADYGIDNRFLSGVVVIPPKTSFQGAPL